MCNSSMNEKQVYYFLSIYVPEFAPTHPNSLTCSDVVFVVNGFSEVFHMEPKTHAGHMKAVKKLILEGTSKWSAKILITGKPTD